MPCWKLSWRQGCDSFMFLNIDFKISTNFVRQKEKGIDQVILTLRERSERAKLSKYSLRGRAGPNNAC